jgi:DNA mismatch repair protein MutS
MMEMVETANILHNAGRKSLVILDEIGRGTSTYDGMSIAKAVVEYISRRIGAKTLFATHYHELTELEGKVRGVKNLHVTVEEIDGKIIFTHKVYPGASEKSYGIHVAELAGIPKEVINRAKEILHQLEGRDLPLFKLAEKKEITWNSELEEKLIEELESIEISTTTPLEALMILSRLKELAKTIKRRN